MKRDQGGRGRGDSGPGGICGVGGCDEPEAPTPAGRVTVERGAVARTTPLPERIGLTVHIKNLPVFGLSHLLGINLMPRIRNWKDLKLFRPSRDTHYKHIDGLFAEAIDWHLIYTHLPDMLRVVLSIQAGCPSQTDELSTVIKCSFTFYNTLKMLI